MSEERFIDLETRLAHQDQLLHELNDVVTANRRNLCSWKDFATH